MPQEAMQGLNILGIFGKRSWRILEFYYPDYSLRIAYYQIGATNIINSEIYGRLNEEPTINASILELFSKGMAKMDLKTSL
jgi:hypothetical protein